MNRLSRLLAENILLFAGIFFAIGIGFTVFAPAANIIITSFLIFFFIVVPFLAALVLRDRSHLVVILLPIAYFYTLWMMPHPATHDIATLADNRQIIKLTIQVKEEPVLKSGKTVFIATLEPGQQYNGNVRAITIDKRKFAVGDRLSVSGYITQLPAARNSLDFSYREYMAKRGIYSQIQIAQIYSTTPSFSIPDRFMNLLIDYKTHLLNETRKVVPEPYNGLLGSIILGSKASPISDTLLNEFRAVGLGHMLAVSGFQVALIMGFILLLLRKTNIKPLIALIITIAVLMFYCILTGATPSVVRAVIMGIIASIGLYMSREGNVSNIMGATAVIMLLINPMNFFDIGFQMSFLATFGIIYLAPLLSDALKWLPTPVALALGLTLASQIMIVPLQFLYFNQFSLWSIPANLIAGGLVAWLTVFGFISYLLTSISYMLAIPFDLMNLVMAKLLVATVSFFYQLPGVSIDVASPHIAVVILYYIVLFILLELAHQKIITFSWKKVLIFILLFANIYLLIPQNTITASDELHIISLNVGQGDATLIITPHKNVFLIDGGNRAKYDNGKEVIIPYLNKLGIHKIDAVIATHPDSDHIGGLISIIENMPVSVVYDSGQSDNDIVYHDLLETALVKHISIERMRRGDKIFLDEGIYLDILNPMIPFFSNTGTDSNANCIITMLHYKDFRELFTADMELVNEIEFRMSNIDPHANVLKVAHHGSKFASSEEFLSMVKPEIAIISVGFNGYGHPAQPTLERLSLAGAAIFRTDQLGTIEITTDGKTYNISNMSN